MKKILLEARAMLALALPIVGTQLAWMAMHTTDVFLLARYSEAALAAGALGVAVMSIFWMTISGLGMATSAQAAQARGHDRADLTSVRRAVHDGLILTGLGGLFACLVFIFSEPLLLLIGQVPALAKDTSLFLQGLAIGFVPSLWYQVLRNFCAALERPRPALFINLVAILLNAALNYVLIAGAFGLPGHGVAGAGIGTSVINLISLAALSAVVTLDRGFGPYRVFAGWWRSNAARLMAYLKLGLPIGLMMACEVGLFSIAALMMGHLGASEVAAHQIALQWAIITFMVPMGLSQAATVRVGLYVGANDAKGSRRAGWVAIGLAEIFMASSALLFWFRGDDLVAVFLPLREGEAFHLAASYIIWAAIFQIVDGAQATAGGALRGRKDTAWPMAIAIFGYAMIGLPMAYWFGFHTPMRGEGIWLGLATSLAVVAALLVGRFALLKRAGPAAA